MERALSHDEFMAKVNRDYAENQRKKKKHYLNSEADIHAFENKQRIRNFMRRYNTRRVNCGRC